MSVPASRPRRAHPAARSDLVDDGGGGHEERRPLVVAEKRLGSRR
ncbi:hypothetical protein OHA25_60480 (plasmid) [Nonomuraea sp. NBC_00507]